jgi:RNA polymerase sigma factor (sigma-70 family)
MRYFFINKDLEIIKGLKSNDEVKVNKTFRYLYRRYFKMALKIINKMDGNDLDAEDVFQEALLTLYENIRNDRFRGESSLTTYLYSILRNQWSVKRIMNNARKNVERYYSKKQYSELLYEQFLDLNHLEVKEILLERLLEDIGNPCKSILKYYYYDNLPMKEISERMHYSSEDTAKTQKYKCMLKLIKYLEDHPFVKNSIIEVI